MFIFSGKAHYSKSTFLTLLFSKQIYPIDRLFFRCLESALCWLYYLNCSIKFVNIFWSNPRKQKMFCELVYYHSSSLYVAIVFLCSIWLFVHVFCFVFMLSSIKNVRYLIFVKCRYVNASYTFKLIT